MVKHVIEIPEKVEARIDNRIIKVKGPKGELEREFPKEYISINKKDDKIIVSSKKSNKSSPIAGTFRSHIRNMIRGVQKEFVYKVKVCFSHFPMSVEASEDKLIIKNFLGGSKNREIKIPEGVSVEVDGKEIKVSSMNKEKAGSFAGIIEQRTKAKGKDLRVFQDGCYIVSKPKD